MNLFKKKKKREQTFLVCLYWYDTRNFTNEYINAGSISECVSVVQYEHENGGRYAIVSVTDITE